MDHAQYAQILYNSRLMRSEAEVAAFEDARIKLSEQGNSAVLPYFFAAFDDATEQHEVMWGLVHEVEGFDLETYLKEMVSAAPSMIQQAKEWLIIMHKRILATRGAYAVYREILSELPVGSVQVLGPVLEEFVTEKAPVGERARTLIELLSE